MRLLSGQVNRRKIKLALDKLPEKLGDAYDEVWDRVFNQDDDRQTIARAALTWITYAKQRLTVDMLLRAIALSLEPDIERLEEEDLIDVELLLSSCAGLVILNQEDEVIRLVHYTTQDYLERRLPKIAANTSIARVCLSYFGLEGVPDIPEGENMPEGMVYASAQPSFPEELPPVIFHAGIPVPPPPLRPSLRAPPRPLPRSHHRHHPPLRPPPPLPDTHSTLRLSSSLLRPMYLKRSEMLAGYAAVYWGIHASEGWEEDLAEFILSTLRTQRIRDRIDSYDIAFRFPGASSGKSLLSLLHLVSRYGLSHICSKLLNNDKLSPPCPIPIPV
jgi:hypothetical protein